MDDNKPPIVRAAILYGAKIVQQSDGLWAILDAEGPLWWAVFRSEVDAAHAYRAWVLR